MECGHSTLLRRGRPNFILIGGKEETAGLLQARDQSYQPARR
jgi:hypothetical protein